MHRRLCILFFLGLIVFSLWGQTPFTCEGQVWVTEENGNGLLRMSVGSNNSITTTRVQDDLGVQVHALGFRKTDRMLYGINPLTHELYRIDATGNVEILTIPNVDRNIVYLAGDVTPDGSRFVIIGSVDGFDTKLLTINLESGNYEVTETNFRNGTRTVDIGFHPINSTLFGFDSEERQFYTYELGTNTFNGLGTIFIEHNLRGFYFDAFGNMFGLGTAIFGAVGGLFSVDQSTGGTRLISTSGLISIGDMAGCPYSVEMDSKVFPETSLPCSDITFEYTFANQTGEVMENVLLEHELPAGYTFFRPTTIPFGGVLDNSTPENLLRIENLAIPQGIQTYTVEAYVDDIPKETYKSQASLSNIPPEFGRTVISNDPVSAAIEDSTRMKVNRFDEDSLKFANLLCEGSLITLDGSDYGSDLIWSNGATSQTIDVSETGLFTLTAESGCQELIVSFDVVSASCPFTIELRHMVQPDTVFGCGEALFRYILENDSGEDRFGAILLDTLPDGFTFIEILNNPYEGQLSPNLPPNVFQLENIRLLPGIDTIDVLVRVGEFVSGNIRNKAVIKGLPELLGNSRTSDDPTTSSFPDSTSFFVKGVDSDSLQIDTSFCRGVDLVLDASLFGKSFLWEDGSEQSQFSVNEPGDYQVWISDGCDTANVVFHVVESDPIQVSFPNSSFSIHQSESIDLRPFINNSGDSLRIQWNDLMTNSLSCLDCPQVSATPLSDIIYTVFVENEVCSDSAMVEVLVDEMRRVFIPDAFSPNNDGINDFFYFQSPDPGSVQSFQVFDRWGGLVFEKKDFLVNEPESGWDGIIRGKIAPLGVYIWQAEIQFFDGNKERWSGEVSVFH